MTGVSIVIDCFNHENFVKSAIDSALAQTFDPVQVIVIDDGSSDQSPAVIREFGDRIQMIFQENRGQVAACRRALACADYDIVMILDSDDLLAPEAAERVAAVWQHGVTAKIQFCLRVIDENGSFNGDIFPKYTADMTPDIVRAEMFRTGSYPDSPTSGNAFDRQFLEMAMSLLPRRNGLDGELNGIAPLYGEVVTIDQPLGYYRIHGDNDFAQTQLSIEKFQQYLDHSEARVAFIREHYQSKGHVIEPDVLDHDLKYLEYKLVVEKIGKADDKQPRKLGEVARLAIKAALQSPYAPAQKLFRVAWMAAVTVAPKKLAAFLIEQRFVPGQRRSWMRHITSLHPGSWKIGDKKGPLNWFRTPSSSA